MEAIKDRNICERNKLTWRPMFKVDLLDYKTFQKLFREDGEYILSKSQDMTLKNIGKYNLK